jgi:biopolymer transport protein ExbB
MDLYKMNLWQVFLAGGAVMWPILACSIFAFAIALDKFLYLRKISLGSRDFLEKILDKMKRHEIKEALQICDTSNIPLANILKAGILKYDRPRQQIIEALENASLYEIPLIKKNLSILATIAHITPLLGFLGTVTGMIKCFQAIHAKSVSLIAASASDLAGGLWEALLATVAGLIVSIPAYIIYNYLADRINDLILDMEKASTELVNLLTE